MPRKVHTPDAQTRVQNMRTAVIVTLIAGLTLVLLSTAVFSLASTTRTLSNDAEKLHIADESLRAATTARAQLALALHGSRVDSKLGSDSSAAVSASVGEAQQALDSFNTSVNLLDNTDLRSDGDAFLTSANASVASLDVATAEAERATIDSDLDDSYQMLIKSITAERESLLADVERADRRMGTLGNLASFVVAFLLPTSAIFIYRQLARRPRRQVELEHELDLERRIGRDRASALNLGLAELNDRIETGNASGIVAEAERFAAATALVYGQHTYDVARVDLATELEAIAAASPETQPSISSEHVPVLIDVKALHIAIHALIETATDQNANRVHLNGRNAPAAGKIDVLSDGEPIPALTIRDALLESNELTAASSPLQRQLVLVRTLLEGMGARLKYEPGSEHQKFEITLPRAARKQNVSTANPSLAPTP